MIVGFTGTRKGMNTAQLAQLNFMLATLKRDTSCGATNEFHQGGADGGDKQARILAREWGYDVHWHPCPGVSLADVIGDEPLAKFETWHEVFPPLTRNRNIVAVAFALIAGPHTDVEELRSGTWATVRYARAAAIPVVHLTRGAE